MTDTVSRLWPQHADHLTARGPCALLRGDAPFDLGVGVGDLRRHPPVQEAV
ncbi:hypothetical protein [Tropicibacter oceani]|uniref:Uncharacterized protein n=1 Tax=Tropicibacter oceani TaxID=3058420 RepID=A0ABY8QI19_9RHOB|nr:hypothetical protein [Tropicibacter oceani]WGW04260.1 hypothetical protein QF118_01605 [Tropicibacter oceani]